MLNNAGTSHGDIARKSLRSEQHWQHASPRERTEKERRMAIAKLPKPSIEDPHNHIHGGLGGVMATFQSSFHPVFWLHHNNIDRFYQKYTQMHPDSLEEFRAKQAKLKSQGDHEVAAGYPEGPYGTYHGGGGPFKTATGKDFHADHCFDPSELGYEFDSLPEPPPEGGLNMQEMPTFAVFPSIDINQMEKSMNLHVFVSRSSDDDFKPPTRIEDFESCPQYAGYGAIFGLFPPGGCTACKASKPFDVSVDITGALRRNKLRKAETALVVVVESAADGILQPLAETPVPSPMISGPTFENIVDPTDISAGAVTSNVSDVEALQKYLVAMGYKSTEVVDGAVGDKTVEAIKALQTAAGLTVDGVVGPITKAKIVSPQVFQKRDHSPFYCPLGIEHCLWQQWDCICSNSRFAV